MIGKIPNELLTEAEAEIRKGLLMRERNIGSSTPYVGNLKSNFPFFK